MTWVSGRTIFPASGELVFYIDENANLPPAQIWDQVWQIARLAAEPTAVEKSSLALHFAAGDHPQAFASTRAETTTIERRHLARHRVRVFYPPFLLRDQRCSA
jgi:hypothetical protein